MTKQIHIAAILFLLAFLCLAQTGYSSSVKAGSEQSDKNDTGKIPEKKIISHDGQFIKYADEIVHDKITGLDWYAGPDEGIEWDTAKSWVEGLDGYGWRLPDSKELKTLYSENKGTRNMTPLIKTTGWYVWSGEEKPPEILVLDFNDGSIKNFWCYGTCNVSKIRVFAVRSEKE